MNNLQAGVPLESGAIPRYKYEGYGGKGLGTKTLPPIEPGFIRIHRSWYHYGRQGQTTLSSEDIFDCPEDVAARYISGGGTAEWPDGYMESFFMRTSPVEYSGGVFGDIPGIQGHVKLSRGPWAVGYSNVISITQEQRASFVPFVWPEYQSTEG